MQQILLCSKFLHIDKDDIIELRSGHASLKISYYNIKINKIHTVEVIKETIRSLQIHS